VKHYPKTYENVSAYVSFHTFFWRKWRFIPLPGFSNIIWYYFIPHVDTFHTFLFSYPLWQGFIPPATFIHTSSYFTHTQLHTRCAWVSYQDACSHCEHFTLTFCYFIPARVHTCSFSSSYYHSTSYHWMCLSYTSIIHTNHGSFHTIGSNVSYCRRNYFIQRHCMFILYTGLDHTVGGTSSY
jgi:hypothetical protein